MDSTSANLLLRLAQPNQPDAWQRFVQLYTPLLHTWAKRLGLQEQDTLDLVQDVFTTLLQKLPEFRYEPGKSFRAWLRMLLRNRWFDIHRRAQKVQSADEAALAALADSAEEFWEVDYRQHLVKRALELMQADFQPTTWKACWEVVVCDRPAAEVAAELGLTVGAVHSARFRVLGRLREELSGMID